MEDAETAKVLGDSKEAVYDSDVECRFHDGDANDSKYESRVGHLRHIGYAKDGVKRRTIRCESQLTRGTSKKIRDVDNLT